MRLKEESRRAMRVIDETKWKTERGREEAGQVTEASLIATQKKGEGLFQRTVMLVCSLNRISLPPPHRLDKSRTSCSCYGRKKRKCAVSLGRSLAARQIGRNRTRNGPTRCLLVCTCVHRVVQARLHFVCVGELQQDTTCFPLLFLCRIIFASIFLLLNHRVQENRKILTRSVKNLVDLITAVD